MMERGINVKGAVELLLKVLKNCTSKHAYERNVAAHVLGRGRFMLGRGMEDEALVKALTEMSKSDLYERAHADIALMLRDMRSENTRLALKMLRGFKKVGTGFKTFRAKTRAFMRQKCKVI